MVVFTLWSKTLIFFRYILNLGTINVNVISIPTVAKFELNELKLGKLFKNKIGNSYLGHRVYSKFILLRCFTIKIIIVETMMSGR